MKVFTVMVIYSPLLPLFLLFPLISKRKSFHSGERMGGASPTLSEAWLPGRRGGTSSAALISWKHSRGNREEPLRERDLLSIKNLGIRGDSEPLEVSNACRSRTPGGLRTRTGPEHLEVQVLGKVQNIWRRSGTINKVDFLLEVKHVVFGLQSY